MLKIKEILKLSSSYKSILLLAIFLPLLIYSIFSLSAKSSHPKDRERKFVYPVARRNESIVDDFNGIKIADPYRWLEDPDSEDTRKFVELQNKISESYLEDNPGYDEIYMNLLDSFDYPKYNVPIRKGDFYYSYMNTGSQYHDIFYKQKTLDDKPEVFLDPNTLSKDGTISLQETSFSHDGGLMAYGLSEFGSDWMKIKIRDVNSSKDYPDELQEVKYSMISWTVDNKGFFYCRFPEHDGSRTVAMENQKLYYHRVGEPQEKDILVVEFLDNPTWLMYAVVTDCGKYFILIIVENINDQLIYFADLEKNGEIKGKLEIKPIVTKFEAGYEFITSTGSNVIFRTNKNALNLRLISIDLNKPGKRNWRTLIQEHPENVLDWARCVDRNKLIIHYTDDVKSALQVHSLSDGKLIRKLPLEMGQIENFSGNKKYSEIFYKFVSFLTPDTIYKYDFAKPDEEPSVFREAKPKLDAFDRNDFKVEQVFYSSRDGTKIPMFIVQRKQKANARPKPKPCLLYGYGGFSRSILPFFSVTNLMFINLFDGIFALPNIRGGGEYGEKWHNDGRLLNKQNGFDDFQAAAEYLVRNKYTKRRKIAIFGSSNGGLLIGACINQRPDLFGAAIADASVIDMLRFHKFTVGRTWISEYGNPDEKKHFNNLIKFSPLHNVRAPNNTRQQYPATLILAGDHDDRVSPLHSLKFAAQLQYVLRDNPYQMNPILLRVYMQAGHEEGTSIAIDLLSFIHRSLKLNIKL